MTPKFVMTRKLVSGIVTFLIRKASVVIATTPHKARERGSPGLDLSATPAAGRDILRAAQRAKIDRKCRIVTRAGPGRTPA
jgi:hypothetical protein